MCNQCNNGDGLEGARGTFTGIILGVGFLVIAIWVCMWFVGLKV